MGQLDANQTAHSADLTWVRKVCSPYLSHCLLLFFFFFSRQLRTSTFYQNVTETFNQTDVLHDT